MRKLCLSFGLVVLASCQTAPTPAPPAGNQADGVTSWLGIEYAQAERWALPQEGPDWLPEETYTQMGPACPQSGQSAMVEDCLFLNVFAPDGADDLPVVVWIHGGGFKQGEGGDYVRSLAREDIVAVSFNYRLGMLGFHDWAGWNETDPRNFGQADMVMALAWVQANIDRFGGDPDNVTIMGHSAGGMGVQLMMVDDRADGLYHKAIAHSGYAAWPYPTAYNPSDEERMRIRYAALDHDASPKALVEQVEFYHLPYIGGSDLAAQPLVLFQAGQSEPVPYLTGANSHDGRGTLQGAGFTHDEMITRYGSDEAVRAAYAADFSVSDALAAERLFGDMRYAFSARETARAHQGTASLFLLDAPENGRTHSEHYEELFGLEPSNFRDLVVDFIKTGTHAALRSDDWLVLNPDMTIGAVPGLDTRLDTILDLEFPQP